ncbi:MAG TPA: adenylate/guanylate cyclase domain-containing protein [Actinomycetota bacterium]|nr:adenylate/guanylate cyclase domain-containing protein [Actinomycetota bacterium]
MALCPACGEENPGRAKFCLNCGTPLATAPPSGGEERKVVSILFVDLVGFTARSHAADPEDVRAALVPYHALLKREIERFGGTVEKFIGDAVMAVFGAPVAHEDDAERAVRIGLRIIEAISELNQKTSFDLSVRAAVNTGEGLVTLGARPEAGEGLVTGDVVNTASRLQNEAPVNNVVVGEVTYRSTKDVIDYEELEPVMVKGKPEPVAVWRAISARSRFGVDVNVVSKTPFIGREFELTTLKIAYGRAIRESSLQLATIVGEPGVGKSRLLSEFSSFVDDQEELIFWRQGRSLPYGEGITFWALGEIIKAQAGILESDSTEEATGKLRIAVAAVVKDTSEHAWFLSRLGPLVGVEVSSSSPQKEESFTAWRRFLEAIAERGPLVIVFEDLHWADPSLLEFIEHLADWVTGVPMFVVCTARPELYDSHPNWGGGKRNITVVSLARFNDSEIAQLISSLLSQAVLPAEIHAALLERAGGNPLYAEEFIRMLRDRGILKAKGKVLALERDTDIPLPESIHALIAARLDTLSPERKSLLQDASVAGKVFWSGAVAAIGQKADESVRQGLHELGAKELVRISRTSSMEGHQEYVFWHALIRDVSYSQIPRAARARKHQAMAAWIENTAERLDDYAEVLAHHYSLALELAEASGASDLAALRTKACGFLVTAGARALKLDPANALDLYRQALELFEPADKGIPKALLGAGIASRFLGQFPQGARYLEDAIAGLAEQHDLNGQGTALEHLSVIMREQGRADEARAMALRAVELLEQQPPGHQLASAYRAAAFYAIGAAQLDEALALVNKAVSVARSSGGNDLLGPALDLKGLIRCDSGDIGGLEDLEEAIKLSESGGQPLARILAYNNMADRIWLIDGPSEGYKFNHKAQVLGRSTGYLYDAFWVQMGGLFMLFEQGDWDRVQAEADEIASWAREHGTSIIAAAGLFFTARISLHRGAVRKALDLEPNFLPIFRDLDDLEGLSPCLAFCALMHADSGDEAGALALIEEFAQTTERSVQYRARFLSDVMRAMRGIGDTRLARRLLSRTDDMTYARDRHAVVTGHAIEAESDQRWDEALELYTDGARRWHGYGFLLEEGHALLGAGRCLIAMERRTEATPKLRKALNIFTKLGAAPLVEETNDCLKLAIALSS